MTELLSESKHEDIRARANIFERLLEWTLRIFIASVYGYAGVSKAFEPVLQFSDAIDSYQVLPTWAVHTVSIIFPPLEIYVAAMLLFSFGKRWRIAAKITITLSVFFIFLLVQAAVRGLDLKTCGCFGGHTETVGFAIVKNVAILLALIWLLWREKRRAIKENEKHKSAGKTAAFSSILFLAIASICTGFIYNTVRENPVDVFAPYKTEKERLAKMIGEIQNDPFSQKIANAKAQDAGAIGIISADDFAHALVQNSALKNHLLVMDARADWFYQKGHLPNSINISAENFKRDYITAKQHIENAKRIVVYCNGGTCEAAEKIATALRDVGIQTKIEIFTGNWEDLKPLFR